MISEACIVTCGVQHAWFPTFNHAVARTKGMKTEGLHLGDLDLPHGGRDEILPNLCLWRLPMAYDIPNTRAMPEGSVRPSRQA